MLIQGTGDETIGMGDDKEKDSKASWLTSLQTTVEKMLMTLPGQLEQMKRTS